MNRPVYPSPKEGFHFDKERCFCKDYAKSNPVRKILECLPVLVHGYKNQNILLLLHTALQNTKGSHSSISVNGNLVQLQ